MDVMTAIMTRRSIGIVKPDPVPTELIHQILEAGTYAPAHHRTEPWRFFVLTGEGRKKLGKTLASIVEKSLDDLNSEESQKRLLKEEQKPLRAPVVIAVAVEPTINHKVLVKEEYAAVNASIQNILLAAHALGLGAIWRTGNVCYSQEVKKQFGLSDHGEMLGFIYIGYPDMKELKGKRKHFSEVTKWIEDDKDFS
ncbi:nitroreductase [Bacillus sp. SA1-12]|uniref:nitroreductase family protein n=1 Tax=Bacillus sp. SA1-12 TaxID=1455638 RepID=UPI0006265B71|nr:nitroreductase [Bacillus sp. SA1-12]KKI92473.1 nitroreductase [Bacillus sp. SA1-12]